jgi:hypothetical protein
VPKGQGENKYFFVNNTKLSKLHKYLVSIDKSARKVPYGHMNLQEFAHFHVLHVLRCNIQEFCCNGLQGVTWSYMALQDHLVSVTAIFFHVMCKLPVT